MASAGVKPAAAQQTQIKAELSPGSQPLYARSQSLLKNCNTLVKEWDKLVEYASSVEEPPTLGEVWDRDYAEARRIIALGRQSSEADVKKLLTYEGNSRGNVSKEMKQKQKEFEQDDHLQEMLKMGREENADGEMQESRGWGFVAHRAKRGLEALVAALPDEHA